MKLTRYGVLGVMAGTVLAACGGGSDNSSSSTQNGSQAVGKDASQTISNASAHSVSELNKAARSLASASYNGSQEKAELDFLLAQQVTRMLLDDDVLKVPEIVTHELSPDALQDENIDATFDCDEGGSVSYTGKLEESGEASLSLNFDSCKSYYNDSALTGVAALVIKLDVQQNTSAYTLYFDNLRWHDGQAVSLSGLMAFNESADWEMPYTTLSQQYIALSVGNETYLLDAETTGEAESGSLLESMQGRLSVASRGYIDFSYEPQTYTYDYNGSTLFFNGDEAYVNFEQDTAAFVIDTDQDGITDAGKILSRADFFAPPPADASLNPLTEISSQPYAGEPYTNESYYTVSTDIDISPGYFFDIETPRSQLEISYNWYINGILLEGVHGSTLPAYSAGVHDEVTVSMVVSDATHSYESYQQYIWLEDMPAELTVTDMPASIAAGETVSFSVVLTDPDIESADNLARLTNAPQGASMSEDGTVTWQVPQDLLFSEQSYYFGFSNRLNPNETIEKTVTATVNASQPLPLFRSGIEVPAANRSQWVVDIDGDGQNELLSTDNDQRVFLLSLDNGQYQQKWAYPYVLSQQETIQQVLPIGRNQAGSKPILVVTDHALWRIDDLAQPARQIFNTDNFLRAALLADIDGDGTEELIYHAAADAYSATLATVNVVALDDPSTELMSFTVDAFSTFDVGNVDTDANLELVLNTGSVFDLVTAENEWQLGTGFSTQYVTTGDLNGDGIDEIISADSWGAMYVFSVTEKTQLDSRDAEDICDLRAFNVNQDDTDEIIISDCQWGQVQAFTLDENSALAQLWSVDLQEHGSTSLSAGDIDNDGHIEVLWGSGVSSSGRDILVTADVVGTTATVKPETSPVQLDAFAAAGWATTGADDEQGIFTVPTTDSGYSGLSIARLNQNGTVDVNDKFSSFWQNGMFSAITDTDNDGIDDILLPTTGTYDYGLGAFALSDLSSLWTVYGDYDTNINQIKLQDINNDGHTDVMFADGDVLTVIDTQTQEQLTSYRFSQSIADFDVADIDGVTTVLVTLREQVHILTLKETRFTVVDSVSDILCNRILFYGQSNQRSVACLWTDYGASLRTMRIVDNQATELETFALEHNAVAIAVDPTDPQRFIIAANTEDGWYDARSQLHSLTAQGKLVWSGPVLIGSANVASLQLREQTSGKLEILYGTSKGMYWIH